MRLGVFLAAAAALVLALPVTAGASSSIRYGVQDDAWLSYGPGTIDQRAARLHDLGVSVVRYNLHWNEIARSRPASAASPSDPAYDWGRTDEVLRALRRQGIAPLLTLVGTPSWANGGRGPNWAPTSPTAFGAFAAAAAKRYAWVTRWAIWNEPNQRIWLRPTSPRVYVRTLLDPAYAAIHRAIPRATVAGGVTAPRGAAGGVSPVDFIEGMGAAHARLDAYAHNPYPLSPAETPTSGGCATCRTITMATLPRLLSLVTKTFGSKTRIWLTEYGYQSNPPDTFLGVSYALQSRYLAEAAHRAYAAPRVDLLIQFLVQDEPSAARWQSGLMTTAGRPKPALHAFSLPLAEVSRTGRRTTLWGQVRPGSGRRLYRLQVWRSGAWRALGAAGHTDARGFLQRTMSVPAGSRVRLYAPAADAPGATLVVR